MTTSPAFIQTANGYLLCATHAEAWQRGGNTVSMWPANDDEVAEGGGACADCAEVSPPCTPFTAADRRPTVTAAPYEARQCPECHVWIYTAAGPFGEDNDPTKTVADYLHYEREHLTEAEAEADVIGFPFFPYNEAPVAAVREVR